VRRYLVRFLGPIVLARAWRELRSRLDASGAASKEHRTSDTHSFHEEAQVARSNKTEQKPVVDAVNDAISALTDLVRSLRGSKKQHTDIKSRASAAGREVKQGARDMTTEAKRVGKHLKSRFERAWHALTSEAGGATNGRAPARAKSKKPRRATARARA
jgi:hypothetical protein